MMLESKSTEFDLLLSFYLLLSYGKASFIFYFYCFIYENDFLDSMIDCINIFGLAHWLSLKLESSDF
jgi:hypothetical protein